MVSPPIWQAYFLPLKMNCKTSHIIGEILCKPSQGIVPKGLLLRHCLGCLVITLIPPSKYVYILHSPVRVLINCIQNESKYPVLPPKLLFCPFFLIQSSSPYTLSATQQPLTIPKLDFSLPNSNPKDPIDLFQSCNLYLVPLSTQTLTRNQVKTLHVQGLGIQNSRWDLVIPCNYNQSSD